MSASRPEVRPKPTPYAPSKHDIHLSLSPLTVTNTLSSNMGKIVHIVLWKLKAAASEEAANAAKQAIAALKTVPGPEQLHLGPPAIDARAKGYNWGLYSTFADRAALDKYAVSDAHVKVVQENVKPNVDDVMAYDFELDE